MFCNVHGTHQPHTSQTQPHAIHIKSTQTTLQQLHHKLRITAFCSVFDKYTYVPCVSYLYFMPFFGVWANVYPPTHFAVLTTTLSFLNFYMWFFSEFFLFLFFLSWLLPCVLILPSIYPLFCPTIAWMSFCVQLVTRGNLKRLERKYEGFVYCVWIWYLFCVCLVVKC